MRILEQKQQDVQDLWMRRQMHHFTPESNRRSGCGFECDFAKVVDFVIVFTCMVQDSITKDWV